MRNKAHLVGLNPPRKSAVSVCWLQFKMCRRWPLMSASSWHTVVLPARGGRMGRAGERVSKGGGR